MSFSLIVNQEGATYGPRATLGPRRLHFELWKYIFDLDLARETHICDILYRQHIIFACKCALGGDKKSHCIEIIIIELYAIKEAK